MHKLINELEGVLCWPKKPSEKHLVIKWLSKKNLTRKNDGSIYWKTN